MLWDKIDKKYSSPGPTSWFLDFKEFMSWTLDEKKDPANQIASLGAVLTCLKAYGFTVNDEFRALFLMDHIPQSWGNYAQFTLATIEPKNLTMAHVEGLILVKYKQRTGQSSESSLLTCITGDRRKLDSAPNWNTQKAGSSKQKNQNKSKGKQPKPQEPSNNVTTGDVNQGGDKKKKTCCSKKKKGSKKGTAHLANPEVEADSDSDDDDNDAPLMVTAFMANPFMNATLDPIEISDTDDILETYCFIDENNDSSLKERVKRNLAKQVRPQMISGYFILTHYERLMINELAQETVDFDSFLRVEAHHQMTHKLAEIWDYTYNSDGTHTEPYLRAKDLNGDKDMANQWFDHEGTIHPIQKQIKEEVEYFCHYIMNKALSDMRTHKWIPQQFKKREPVPSKPPSLIERAYWPTPAQSVIRTNGVTINTQFHDTSLYPNFIHILPFNHTKASSLSSSRKRKAVRGSSSSKSSDSTSSDHSEESSFKYIPLSVAFKMWQDRMSHMFTDPILENMKREPDESGNTSKKPCYDAPLEEAGPSSLADAINVSISSGYLADDDGVSLGSESDVEIYIDGDKTMAFWQVFHTSNKNSALIQLPQISMSSDYFQFYNLERFTYWFKFNEDHDASRSTFNISRYSFTTYHEVLAFYIPLFLLTLLTCKKQKDPLHGYQSLEHLLELKLACIHSLSYSNFFSLFGLGYHPNFLDLFETKIAPHLSSGTYRFWCSNIDAFTSCKFLFRMTGLRKDIEQMCECDTLEDQQRIWQNRVRPKILSPFAVALLWNPTTFCWNALGVPMNQRKMLLDEGGMYEYVKNTVDPMMSTYLLKTQNYFYRVVLQGQYSPSCCPEYLSLAGFCSLKANNGKILENFRIHTDLIANVLHGMSSNSITRSLIMDHLDWFSEGSEEVEQEISELHQVLAPSGLLFWHSAVKNPWYASVFQRAGFLVEPVGIRGSEKLLDRVSM
ncbi:hypothetical protein D9758_014174 [Tetrapyrgos nigripes]|uniref:Uncharacterized protein n=1 Tax=Tetrapyrgos nigripes TaxID=182062 RepID=A0A8H5CKB8_9AGAR|nr:hypothetical protein D9758_014174 [Tetrapyrgos nigripes]